MSLRSTTTKHQNHRNIAQFHDLHCAGQMKFNCTGYQKRRTSKSSRAGILRISTFSACLTFHSAFRAYNGKYLKNSQHFPAFLNKQFAQIVDTKRSAVALMAESRRRHSIKHLSKTTPLMYTAERSDKNSLNPRLGCARIVRTGNARKGDGSQSKGLGWALGKCVFPLSRRMEDASSPTHTNERCWIVLLSSMGKAIMDSLSYPLSAISGSFIRHRCKTKKNRQAS